MCLCCSLSWWVKIESRQVLCTRCLFQTCGKHVAAAGCASCSNRFFSTANHSEQLLHSPTTVQLSQARFILPNISQGFESYLTILWHNRNNQSIITEIINKSGSDHWVAQKKTDIDTSIRGSFVQTLGNFLWMQVCSVSTVRLLKK